MPGAYRPASRCSLALAAGQDYRPKGRFSGRSKPLDPQPALEAGVVTSQPKHSFKGRAAQQTEHREAMTKQDGKRQIKLA